MNLNPGPTKVSNQIRRFYTVPLLCGNNISIGSPHPSTFDGVSTHGINIHEPLFPEVRRNVHDSHRGGKHVINCIPEVRFPRFPRQRKENICSIIRHAVGSARADSFWYGVWIVEPWRRCRMTGFSKDTDLIVKIRSSPHAAIPPHAVLKIGNNTAHLFHGKIISHGGSDQTDASCHTRMDVRVNRIRKWREKNPRP